MWTKLKDFYDSNKYAIWWTIGYVITTWVIMRYMFNFDIFSAHRWHQLMHAHLHGFAGMVFGILILAMIPLYIATTIVIIRTRAPLFNFQFSIPNFVKNAFIQTPIEESTSSNDNESETASESQTMETAQDPEAIPQEVPAELRVAYAHARDNISRTPQSAFDLGNVTKPVTHDTNSLALSQNESADMPIPTDFDISEAPNIVNDIPIFKDIDFDEEENESSLIEFDDIETTGDTNDVVIKYLTEKSVPYKTEGEVTITDKFAIVSHTDSDFWVADNESWFAAGKIRKSPIALVMATAATNNVHPVLYLGADNIMDIDELRSKWETAGIRVITDLKDLI